MIIAVIFKVVAWLISEVYNSELHMTISQTMIIAILLMTLFGLEGNNRSTTKNKVVRLGINFTICQSKECNEGEAYLLSHAYLNFIVIL